jgi:hypothetical protein
MSKKNLSRTVIEGGRYGRNKYERYQSHADTRAHEKSFLDEVRVDPEKWYDDDIEPTEHVYKGFKDKLGPMYKWLRSHVGEPWDNVRSEVSKTFDTRTTAGRHIVYDHLMKSVEIGPQVGYHYYRAVPGDDTASYSYNDFYVDVNGLLQVKRYVQRKQKAPSANLPQIANWLSGRIVGKVGNKLFWFVPTSGSKKHHSPKHTWKIVWGDYSYYRRFDGPVFQYLSYEVIYKKDSLGRLVLDGEGKTIPLDKVAKWVNTGYPSLRQDRKLNEKELNYWNSIPGFYQEKITQMSPNSPLPRKETYFGY